MQGFIKMSRYAGMREDLVQAGGGNSSYKLDDNKMMIKASGYQLSELTQEEGYAVIDYQKIRKAFLECNHLNEMTDEERGLIMSDAYIEGKRPSIETFLHAISGKYTLHTHPIVVNALACRKGGMEILKKLFPEALLVPYATPGVELAKAFFSVYKKNAKSQEQVFNLVFLQNHGLVVSAETAEEVIEKTEEIVLKLEDYLSFDYSDYHRLTELWRFFPDKIVWEVTDKHILYAATLLAGKWQHAFCPDCVVFLGKKMLFLNNEFTKMDIQKFENEYGYPIIICWRKYYYILADSVKKAMEIQSVMSFSAQVMLINKDQDCDLLTEAEQNFLLNWDAEKYRKTMK